ncbi:unnamed protein product, partial [Allacma fusca]
MEVNDHIFELHFLANLKALEIKNYKLLYEPSTTSKGIEKPAVRFRIFNAKGRFKAKFTNPLSLPVFHEPKSSKTAGIHISNGHVNVTFSDLGTAASVTTDRASHPFDLTFR